MSSKSTLAREGFGPPQFRCIRLGRCPVGYLFYGQRGVDVGLPVIGVLDGPRRGIGSAVVMALIHGACQAGGFFKIIDVDNPDAFRFMLVAEGLGMAMVHLVRNELLLSAKVRKQGFAAYPRKQLPVSDFKIEEVQLPSGVLPILTGIPIERHAWWIERIIIRPDQVVRKG